MNPLRQKLRRLSKPYLIKFTERLAPYSSSITWISEKVRNMITFMNQENLPNGHDNCGNFACARERMTYEEIK